VARNRKRAKERRARRPQPVATGRNEETPGPIGHAAPDVELAEAQLALGRPDLAESADDAHPQDGAETDIDETDIDEADIDEGYSDEGPEVPGVLPGRPQIETGELDEDEGGDLTRVESPVPEPRLRSGNRLINFLQGSWRELQRVQWPDRRQVMQATGVVIGFVIVAGAFLGVADFLASKIVTFILK
jgi:preprotein translocase subunit SecE